MQWVLLSYRLPREPSTPRITLWRSLKRLGSVQVGDGLAALPLDPRTREQFEWLAESVEQNSGEAVVWIAEPSTRRELKRLHARLEAAVADEYAGVSEAARAAEQHGPGPRRRALARLRRNLGEIQTRDYLGSPARQRAELSIEKLAGLAEARR